MYDIGTCFRYRVEGHMDDDEGWMPTVVHLVQVVGSFGSPRFYLSGQTHPGFYRVKFLDFKLPEKLVKAEDLDEIEPVEIVRLKKRGIEREKIQESGKRE